MDFSLFQKHPAITVAVGLVAALVFYEIAIAGPSGGSGATQTVQQGPSDAAITAQANLTGQIAGLQAQAAQRASDQAFALKQNADTSAANFAIAQLQAQTSTGQQTNAIQGQLALATLSTTLQSDLTVGPHGSNATAIAINANNDATQITLNKQTADLQTAITTIGSATQLAFADIVTKAQLGQAGITADVTKTLAGYQAAVTTTEINASRDISITAIQAQKQSGGGDLGGFVAGLIGAFL